MGNRANVRHIISEKLDYCKTKQEIKKWTADLPSSKQKQKSMSRTKERRQRRQMSRNVDTREQATIYLYHKFDNYANDGLI
jgi:IS30 family transposase